MLSVDFLVRRVRCHIMDFNFNGTIYKFSQHFTIWSFHRGRAVQWCFSNVYSLLLKFIVSSMQGNKLPVQIGLVAFVDKMFIATRRTKRALHAQGKSRKFPEFKLHAVDLARKFKHSRVQIWNHHLSVVNPQYLNQYLQQTQIKK